jgi:hypothetical protein
VVHLDQHREGVVLEPFDDPDLPERAIAAERPLEQLGRPLA